MEFLDASPGKPLREFKNNTKARNDLFKLDDMQKSPMLLTQFWLLIGSHTVSKEAFVSLADRYKYNKSWRFRYKMSLIFHGILLGTTCAYPLSSLLFVSQIK